MALTELQLPTKATFYGRLQSAANEMDDLMAKWKDMSEFITQVETADLDAMGVATGQVRTDLNDFRQVIDDMVDLYEGGSVTPTNAPNAIIDKIRRM